jgi:hypothetical protein
MSVDLIVVTRLLIQGDYKYAKCISCSCKVFKSYDKYKCKKGHVHATKSWEFYFQLEAVSLKSFKILRKTLFGNSIISILGFTASQVKDLDDDSALVLMRSLNDYLIGQMACISNKSNIITRFKLYNSFNLLQFLQKQQLEIKNSPFPNIEFTIHDDTAILPETSHYSLIDLVDYITWEEWFTQFPISEPESEYVLAQLSDLKL